MNAIAMNPGDQKTTVELLRFTEEIAANAGAYLLQELGTLTAGDIEVKAYNDFVSYVDKRSEEIIVEGLNGLIPGAGFLAEEQVRIAGQGDYRWIIDPLDGTTNYIQGLPLFSVSIGLEYRGDIILGVVYEPNRNELFSAADGIPSTLNHQPIRVSSTPTLSESLLATGFPYADLGKMEHYMNFLRYTIRNSRGIRRFGSAAVDLAYVACGRFDAFFEYGLKPWDVAAGSLIVKQAGGAVCDFKGKQNYLYGQEIIASNGAVESELQKEAEACFDTLV
jgi:myo-inositol-1(or 4)-monophosphatase